MMIEKNEIENSLKTIIDPNVNTDLVTAGSVKAIAVDNGKVIVDLELGYPAKSFIEGFKEQLVTQLESIEGVVAVKVNIKVNIVAHGVQKSLQPIKNIKNIVAVASGKGGVGKSTTSVNLALALAAEGARVGILDADIYGPSLPKLFSINEKPKSDGKTLIPILKYDIQCMSIGFLTEEQTPMIWRGPMVTSAIKTFTQKVAWKDLDFIIVDMPPGTGDTQLTFSQEIKMDGVIIISTPQEIALQDVKRGIRMFDKLGVKIIGLIDNMSHFIGDDGKKYPIFGEGGVKRTADEFNKEFLGEIPINPEVGKLGDTGTPIVESKPDHEISKIYLNFAKKIKSIYL